MPAGRPTKYDPSMCDAVLELGKRGMSKAQMAQELGIAWSTFQAYVKQHPEFSTAVKDAQKIAQAWWENLGQNMAKTGDGNPTAFIFQMKNRFSDDYRDKITNEHTGGDGGAMVVKVVTGVERD